MTKSDKQNRSFFWATVFLRELYNCGAEHLIISPGSRSTPLVLAATSHPGFKHSVVLDERSAAYIALGIARTTRTPAALICTSGTAAANYYPAVIEARKAGVPMILLTADRPPNLRSIGTSQAIDQIKMFADYPVFFHEAGEPVIEKPDLDRLRQLAGQALNLSVSRQGPVHINFPFRKPLEPDVECVRMVEKENEEMVSGEHPKTAVSRLKGKNKIPGDIQDRLKSSGRPVVIAGPQTFLKQNSATQLADLLNAPLLAEFPARPSNNLIGGFEGFLRNKTVRQNLLEPDVIIRFGQHPVSKSLQLYLDDHNDSPQIHFADLGEWHDPHHTATHRLEWYGEEIDWDLDEPSTLNDWLDKWKETQLKFSGKRTKAVQNESALTDGHVFYHLSKKIPESWNLYLSNSFPLRDWILFGEPSPRPTYVNRGASGIDGIISSAIGSTLGSGDPGILFVGDLAALHDSNAFLSSKLLEVPLVVVVLNNSGGNIFRVLPVYDHQDVYTDFFETPQQVEFKSLAASAKLDYKRITTVQELIGINLSAIGSGKGICLIECVTDSDHSMNLRNRLWNFQD